MKNKNLNSTAEVSEPRTILHVSQQENLPEKYYPTIQDAYKELVLLRQRGMLNGPAVILVHKGDYVLKKSLHFYADVPVEVRPFEQDFVTISGGAPLTGWEKSRCNGKTVWKTTLPETVNELPFLFVNGKLLQAARFPKKGFFRVTDQNNGFMTDDGNCDHFHIRKGDFNPKWYDPENIAVRMIHRWIEESLNLKSFDEKENCLYTASALRYVSHEQNTEYAFYNVKEALSEPGEYYFDRKKHELLLIPESEPFQAVIPTCGTLVRFDSGAQWVTLSGLHFRYGGTHLPLCQDTFDLRAPDMEPLRNYCNIDAAKTGGKKDTLPFFSGAQAACHVPGILLFRNVSDCAVKNCSISACAWYGVQVAEGCCNLTFSGNELSGLGGGGFYIGGGNAAAVEKNPDVLTDRIILRNNHIHDCGQVFHSAIGVLITHACGCVVDNNHIHDLYYSGISCGWTWGYSNAVTRELCICRNHIHDLGKGLLSDMGGIYLLGIQPGTHVYENYIHDIVNRYYGGWGLYTDEGSSHIVLERNIVHDCACEGFHQHYGRENIIRYNIFAFNKANGMAYTRDCLIGYAWPGEPHSKAVNVLHNVILTDGTPVHKLGDKTLLRDHKIFSDFNIIFDKSGKQTAFAAVEQDKLNLKEWQENGLDRHSVFADPGFRNAEKRDFRLKKNSILREYGFEFLDTMLK